MCRRDGGLRIPGTGLGPRDVYHAFLSGIDSAGHGDVSWRLTRQQGSSNECSGRKASLLTTTAREEARAALTTEMSPHHLAPLWKCCGIAAAERPVPAFWRYDDIRPYLMRAGRSDHRRRSGASRADSRKPALRGRPSRNRSTPGCN